MARHRRQVGNGHIDLAAHHGSDRGGQAGIGDVLDVHLARDLDQLAGELAGARSAARAVIEGAGFGPGRSHKVAYGLEGRLCLHHKAKGPVTHACNRRKTLCHVVGHALVQLWAS